MRLTILYLFLTTDMSLKKGDDSSVSNYTQETDAINIGYTVGGMTIGFQDAQTDNANYTTATKDDTRTIGISVAF